MKITHAHRAFQNITGSKDLKEYLPSSNYKIIYFENKSQSIIERIFKGKIAYIKAINWGKKNLENFNYDLIQLIK